MARAGRPLCVLALAAFGAGCGSGLGPATILKDRFDYAAAISETWKTQTLLNIVKLRYLEPPVFLDIGQVVGSYAVEGTITGAATLPLAAPNELTLGGAMRFADRPTITYTPLMGKEFMKGFLTPIPPDAIFFLLEMGWKAENVFMLAVNSINGLNNATGERDAEPDFLRAVSLLQSLQTSGMLGLRARHDKEKGRSTVFFFRTRQADEQGRANMAELMRLLGLKEGLAEYRLVYGSAAVDDAEIAVQSRSLLQIMMEQSLDVDVPAIHAEGGRSLPALPGNGRTARLLRIHSSRSRPADAHASVEHRGHWFYIDDTDLKSKRAFGTTMLLFNFADVEQRQNLPLISISNQ